MKKFNIKEATTAASSGKFKVPIVLSPQPWTNDELGPFIEPVYSYTNAELAYEEADGDFKQSPEEREKIERRTKKISKVDEYLKQFYTGQSDEGGSNIADIENPEDVIKKAVGPLKEEKVLDEDLAVWFGTKKKPKGSKEPKGPWVNICSKVNGKHPPCGRPEAKTKSYPKCRAVHVASKMSESQKRAACQQKRREEKKNPKIGTGNKPTMVSYKTRKESINSLVKKVLKEIYEPKKLYPVESVYSAVSKAPVELKRIVSQLKPIPCVNDNGEKRTCFKIPEVLYVYFSGNY
jgi:hypothetical protein